MKRCPECRRDYYDDTLLYCLDDGNALLEGPASASGAGDEPATAVPAANFVESATQVLSGDKVAEERPTEVGTQNSIAVLPFTNISADAENEYFCDGLAEELLNALAKIEDLKVAARSSAFTFKGKNARVSEVGRTLGVGAVLEGSVRKFGERIRVAVQLVNAHDGYHIWSDRYDREMSDVFAVQDEITLAVVDALKLKLFGDELSAVLKKGTSSTEAYELYLRGRYFWNLRTIANFRRAIEQFERAIEIDLKYAAAYSGLADCYIFLGYYEAVSPREAGPPAYDAVSKALNLDDSLAEAQASMAMYKVFFQFDWAAAERYMLRSIELNPHSVQAHYWYCGLLGLQARFDEAEVQGRIALELDPLAPIVNGNVARELCLARRYQDAVDLSLKSLEVAPDFAFTHWVIGVAYRQMSKVDEAVAHLRRAASSAEFPVFKADLGLALAVDGKVDEARQILNEFVKDAKISYVSPLCMVTIYIGLGETEKALDWLENAWECRAAQLIWLKTEATYDPLREEPRFKDLMKRMNLPE